MSQLTIRDLNFCNSEFPEPCEVKGGAIQVSFLTGSTGVSFPVGANPVSISIPFGTNLVRFDVNVPAGTGVGLNVNLPSGQGTLTSVGISTSTGGSSYAVTQVASQGVNTSLSAYASTGASIASGTLV